jgi:hypothetical protein
MTAAPACPTSFWLRRVAASAVAERVGLGTVASISNPPAERGSAGYPAKIVFWCLAPERLIRNIEALGFRPQAPMAAVPKKDGVPFRWSFLIAMLVLWNALFVLDGFVPWKQPKEPGMFVFLALLMLFVASAAAAHSQQFQALVLKPGRSVAGIRPALNLVQLIGGAGLLAFAAQRLAG